MSKFKKEERIQEEVIFTKSDYDTLRAGMEKYPFIKIHGKLRGGFEQYLAEKHIVRFDDEGRMLICSPYEYSRHCAMKENIDGYDKAIQEQFLRANPEEREKRDERISRWFRETRELFKSIAKPA